VRLPGGAGFRAIAELVGSRVEYRRMDAFDVRELGERFDVVLCFGILHRVTDPIRLLRALVDVLAPGGEILLSKRTARVCAATHPRSRFTSRATCTRAMSSCTGASRPTVYGDWRGS
jgi:2-polyprenyl-3-methyl-5-hydroxy-6-metoxy-1,4-benzoquinol methylase